MIKISITTSLQYNNKNHGYHHNHTEILQPETVWKQSLAGARGSLARKLIKVISSSRNWNFGRVWLRTIQSEMYFALSLSLSRARSRSLRRVIGFSEAPADWSWRARNVCALGILFVAQRWRANSRPHGAHGWRRWAGWIDGEEREVGRLELLLLVMMMSRVGFSGRINVQL